MHPNGGLKAVNWANPPLDFTVSWTLFDSLICLRAFVDPDASGNYYLSSVESAISRTIVGWGACGSIGVSTSADCLIVHP